MTALIATTIFSLGYVPYFITWRDLNNALSGVMIPPGDNNNSGNGDAQIARHRKRNRDALVLVFYVSFLMGMSLSERVNMNKTWRNELERIKGKNT